MTNGPLLEFFVDGKESGERIRMKRSGGSVSIQWECQSVTVPMTQVDLVVNGEIRESWRISRWSAKKGMTLHIKRSSWVAILIRGKAGICAHSSAVMIEVEGTELFSAVDAITMLDQIEGALAFLETVATRADIQTHRKTLLKLEGVHRRLHNRLHALGQDHHHR